MGSIHGGNIYQVVKTNKTGSRVTFSAQKGAGITNTTPQQGHGSITATTPRSAGSVSHSVLRRPEAGNPIIPASSSDYPHSVSPKSGPSFLAAPMPRGTENQSKSEAYRHSSRQRKTQQTHTPASHAFQMQRNISPPREESTRRGGESKSGRDTSNYYSLAPDAKYSHHLSFVDQKDNIQILQAEDPPSKVQYPQGVRVPRRTLVYPKDEAVQTDPIRRSVPAAEIRSSRRPSSPERGSSRLYTDSRTGQRRISGQETETGHYNSLYTEPKALHRNRNLQSSLKLSVLKDLDDGYRVSTYTAPESTHKHSIYTETKPSPKVLSSEMESNMKSSMRGDNEVSRRVTISSAERSAQSTHRVASRAIPESPHKSVCTPLEPVYKQHTQRPSENVFVSPGSTLKSPECSPNLPVHAKVELTPRPLPPRSLPVYGPESSWWALLNTEGEMPQSQPRTPHFKPNSPSPIDSSLPFFEMDSSPFYEDLTFQREKASASPPPLQSPKEPPGWAPLREVPQAPKCTSKEPIQRFSAFFLGM